MQKTFDINHEVEINTTAHKVYQAITTQEGLAKWWTKDTLAAKPEAGFVDVFEFAGEARTEMTITKLVPNKRVEWECTKGPEEWVGTKVTFGLEEEPNTTLVRFAHIAWKEKTEFFATCDDHWAGYMKSLKQYAETGKGKPYGE